VSHYILLMRYHSSGIKSTNSDANALLQIHEALERWEAKIVSSHVLLGEWDQCTIIDAPDNFKAYRATLAQEFGTTAETEILPAIDLPLFQRLMSQSGKTGGPHRKPSRPIRITRRIAGAHSLKHLFWCRRRSLVFKGAQRNHA